MDNSIECGNCIYWIPKFHDFGECHRNPPTIYSDSILNGLWPKTFHKEWCGDFKGNQNAYNN